MLRRGCIALYLDMLYTLHVWSQTQAYFLVFLFTRCHTQAVNYDAQWELSSLLCTLQISPADTHTQPFKLQLLLSAESNQKQTRGPQPSLPPHTSLGDVLWFPVQSIAPLPYLPLGPHDTLQLSGGQRELIVNVVIMQTTVALLFVVILVACVLPYQL